MQQLAWRDPSPLSVRAAAVGAVPRPQARTAARTRLSPRGAHRERLPSVARGICLGVQRRGGLHVAARALARAGVRGDRQATGRGAILAGLQASVRAGLDAEGHRDPFPRVAPSPRRSQTAPVLPAAVVTSTRPPPSTSRGNCARTAPGLAETTKEEAASFRELVSHALKDDARRSTRHRVRVVSTAPQLLQRSLDREAGRRVDRQHGPGAHGRRLVATAAAVSARGGRGNKSEGRRDRGDDRRVGDGAVASRRQAR